VSASADIAPLFSEQGPLARRIAGYRHRTQQVEMASAIAQAIRDNEILIAEAGTGTGKTFAYLVPTLLSGGKVIISTGTKTLQDQLFGRDLPTVRAALGVPVTTALLKGRANYLCHFHLERTQSEGRFLTREDVKHFQAIAAFAKVTQSGDRAELASVPEDATLWPRVTSTRENCLGQDCGFYKECFVMRARKAALEAEVVVVNHHLFFADVMLRDEGVGELLPNCNTVILDEAHQLPEVATLFFGESISTGQALELARDTRIEAARSAQDFKPLPEAADKLEKAARDVRMALGSSSGRVAGAAFEQNAAFMNSLDMLKAALLECGERLEAQQERGEGLKNCWTRATDLIARLARWREATSSEDIRWGEAYTHSVQLSVTPLTVADAFKKHVEGHARAWILTSATLAVKSDFSHYQSEMGLEAARVALWQSPFDFAQQALLYVPRGLPDPNSPEYTKAVIAAVLPVLKASGGRAFVLFTSLKAMREGAQLLRDAALDYPLLVQGERSRSEHLARFRELGRAVLVGSQTFWEGVDVKGDALSVVIIDKLPFAPPDDPVVAARVQAINKAGRNGFMEYQLPEAIISLKQGAGRLIRDETDRGVLMICDPRLIGKSYGKRVWQSLPPMRRTRELADVQAFFAPKTCSPD
jgi:ATP-dependent DNA helicase DinG